MLSAYEFVCYLGGETALIRLTGCWADEWDIMHPHTALIYGGNRALGVNVFCASQTHAPMLVKAYEARALGGEGKKLADCEGLCWPHVTSRLAREKIAHKTNVSLATARRDIAKRAGVPLPTFLRVD